MEKIPKEGKSYFLKLRGGVELLKQGNRNRPKQGGIDKIVGL